MIEVGDMGSDIVNEFSSFIEHMKKKYANNERALSTIENIAKEMVDMANKCQVKPIIDGSIKMGRELGNIWLDFDEYDREKLVDMKMELFDNIKIILEKKCGYKFWLY